MRQGPFIPFSDGLILVAIHSSSRCPPRKTRRRFLILESLTANASGTYTFTRKYGDTLTYAPTSLNQSIPNDRVEVSQYATNYSYARLVKPSID